MVETTPRVVVLARPGKAAENLADALRQAGADLVAVVDPSGLDQAGLLAHRPQAVLVALEPGIESAIDALDEALSSPGLTVIFDEADMAAQRAGWDAARWVRHLSAKLHRHSDVLPPGAEPEPDMMPTPGPPPTPASRHAAQLDIAPFTREAEGRAGSVPADELRQERPTDAAPPAQTLALDDDAFFLDTLSSGAPAPARDASADFDDASFQASASSGPSFGGTASESIASESIAFERTALEGKTFSDPVFDASTSNGTGLSLEPMTDDVFDGDVPTGDTLRFDLDEGSGFAEEIDAGELSEDELRAFEQAMRASERREESAAGEDEPPAFDTALLQDLGIDPALLEPIRPDDLLRDASDAPSLSLDGTDSLHDFDFARAEPPTAPPALSSEAAPPRPASSSGQPDFSSLSLADDDAVSMPSAPAAASPPRHTLSDLEQRISGLSLVDIEPSDDDAPSRPSVEKPPLRAYDDIAEPIGAVRPAAPVAAPEPDPDPIHAALTSVPVSPPVYAAPVVPPPAMPPSVMPSPVMPPPLPAQQAPPVVAMPAAQAVSAVVLVEAGLGGPDPVRQLLAGLPADFRIPVVVRLQLQGGRYDRLVAQMERAAVLPVCLAAPDQPLLPGRIHFLPDGVGLRRDGGGLRFDVAFAGPDSLYDTLETLDDGALVFLSGSEPGLVDRAASLAAGGALVIAQSPEDCYDGVACAQLRSRGVPVGAAPELAARLARQWPH